MNLDDIRQLFDYTNYANHLAMDVAETLTEEQLLGVVPHAVDLLYYLLSQKR